MAISGTNYALSNFLYEVNGQQAGTLNAFTPPTYEAEVVSQAMGPDGISKQSIGGKPKVGECKIVYSVAQSGPMWTIIESVLNKNCQEFTSAVILADMNYKGKRRIDMMGCMVKELSFPKLDAKDHKKAFDATVSFTVETLKYSPESNAIQGVMSKKFKNWMVANFEPIGMPGGIQANSVMNIELPKLTAKIQMLHVGPNRHPESHYTAWETKGLKTEHASAGFNEVKDLCVKVIQDGAITDSEYADWSVDIKDQTFKTVLGSGIFKQTAPQKFTWAPELKSGDTMATCSVEWCIEEFRFDNKHKD